MRTLLLAAGTVTVLAGCASMGAGAKPTPRYIDIPCTKSNDQVVARAREVLQQAGWTVTLQPAAPVEVEASRAAVYTGAGENLAALGPYRFDLTYPSGTLRLLVETVRVYPDGRAEHGRYHGDDSPVADKRQFSSIVDGLRAFCAQR